MTRIDIDEPDLGVSAALGLAVLRATLGVLVLGHGLQRLFAFTVWQAELSRLGVPYAELVALAAIAAELFAAVGLVLGWLTRFAAFLTLATTALALVALHLRHGLLEYPELAELPALMLAASFLFLWMRTGIFSFDHWLRKRARRRAIQRDDIWLRPPYVAESREDDGLSTYTEPRAASSRH
jgi:putative oxidoreductase